MNPTPSDSLAPMPSLIGAAAPVRVTRRGKRYAGAPGHSATPVIASPFFIGDLE
jgi:hypothetical protein